MNTGTSATQLLRDAREVTTPSR